VPYQPIRHGTIYNRKLAAAADTNRKIRKLIATIIEGGIDHTTLYQTLSAITLLTVNQDDILTDLNQFDKEADQ